MALQNIPVLSTDYPLFDWADYQSCRNALIPDGQTAEFKKETWNAIIDTLSAALAAAGIEWDSKYTTAAGAKITKEYGDLTAAAFNSIRHNIDKPLPIGWAWAWNPEFRGYIGREDFHGFDEYGASCDYVYAEYIIELVRKLNLLLEVMRGTKDKSLVIIEQVLCDHVAKLRKYPSAHMVFRSQDLKNHVAKLRNDRSAHMMYTTQVRNNIISNLLARLRAVLRKETEIRTLYIGKAVSLPSLPLSGGSEFSQSGGLAGVVIPVPSLPISGGSGLANSGGVAGVPVPVHSFSISNATGTAHSVSTAEKLILKKLESLDASKQAVKSRNSAIFGTWSQPLLVGEGTLMIRQAYEANQDGTTLEVI